MTGAAALYDRHVGRYGAGLAGHVLAAAGLREGQRALDVGCGTGLLLAAMAEVTGAARVAGVDPSEAFAAAARERVPGADVRAGGAERLPFADGAFDVAAAQLVLNLVGDVDAAAAELRRVVRPGGVVVACLWRGDRMPVLAAAWDALAEVAPDAVGRVPPDARVGPASAAALEAPFARAGLRDILSHEVEVAADYASFEDLWAPYAAGIGGAGRVLAGLEPAAQAGVRDAVRRRLGVGDEPSRLTAAAFVTRAVV